MKRFSLAVFFVVMATAIVFAQTQADVDVLTQQAESKLNQNPTEALTLATKAQTDAIQLSYKTGEIKATALMGVANYKIDNYDNAKNLVSQAIGKAEGSKDSSNLSFAKYWLATIELNHGEYAKALDLYQNSLEIAQHISDKKNIARALDGKGSIYESLGEDDKAIEAYKQSLATAQEVNFKEWYPTVNFDLANMAYKKGQIEDAISKFNESVEGSDAVGNINNKANCFQQLAAIYYEKDDSKTAMTYVQQAMDLFQQTGSMSSYSYSRLLMSTILLRDKEWDVAIELAETSLDEGKRKGETQLQKNAAEVLYYAYLGKGDKGQALNYHVLFHNLSETNHNEELAKKLTQLELQANFEKERAIETANRQAKEAELNLEIERQNLVKKASLIGLGLLAIIAGLSIFAFFQKRKDNRVIAAEKKKSDELLLNILPVEVANELKASGHSKAKNYEKATVLFADIKNFTGAAEKMSPEKLVEEIDFYFKKFDEIVSRYKIEKIKTIGDAYLCVGGLPVPDIDNANNVLRAALEMQQFMEHAQRDREGRGQIFFEIRIGIHTGPLVAGIVGLRKFAYDIWGDTVNVAARMEQHGEEGKINISGSTYELIKDKFRCTYRGKIEAKNKGQIDMYFVDGLI
ncbi:MAG: adenylate/guanylate cyclase domain-containing protein [Chitinophagales bacterium]